jgi:hypothetical protein
MATFQTTNKQPPVKRAGKTVSEFCAAYHITRRTFELWQRKGIGPQVVQPAANGRIIITEQAEAKWVRKRERKHERKHTALAAVVANAAE